MTKPTNTRKISPATVVMGAMEDRLMGRPSGSFIEDMEAQGQRELVDSTALPTKVNGGYHFTEEQGNDLRTRYVQERIVPFLLDRMGEDVTIQEASQKIEEMFSSEIGTWDDEFREFFAKTSHEANEYVAEEECRRTEEAFRATGIKFGDADPDDPMFLQAELPEGWKKVGTDHSMWSKVVDEQGRERLSIFYKAAFYDRDAHINLCKRFFVTYETVEEDRDKPYKERRVYGVVREGSSEDGRVLFKDTESFLYRKWPDDPEERMNHKESHHLATERAQAWADENLPEGWDDLIDCWNVEVSL